MELIGKCMTMCPIKEVNFRKKHNLLHALEILDIKTNSLNSVSITFIDLKKTYITNGKKIIY